MILFFVVSLTTIFFEFYFINKSYIFFLQKLVNLILRYSDHSVTNKFELKCLNINNRNEWKRKKVQWD